MAVQQMPGGSLQTHSSGYHSKSLRCIIQKGRPTCACSIPDVVRPFFGFPDDLTVENNSILKGNRAFIPKSLHSKYLTVLYKGNRGVEATMEGQEKVFWPSISDEILQFVTARSSINQNNHSKLIFFLIHTSQP